MDSKRILIIDDEPAFLLAAKKVLQEPGFLVDVAETVEEAEDLLSRREYDSVISDVRLSQPDGEEGLAIARLVKNRWPTTKVVLMSAHGGSEMQDRVSSLGVDYFFEKPVPIEALRSALNGSASSTGVSPRNEERRDQ